jgi:hypothetical protein
MPEENLESRIKLKSIFGIGRTGAALIGAIAGGIFGYYCGVDDQRKETIMLQQEINSMPIPLIMQNAYKESLTNTETRKMLESYEKGRLNQDYRIFVEPQHRR